MKKAIIYARHLEYRKYEPTTSEQIKKCKEFAEKKGLKFVYEYFDSSETKLNKYPAFEQLKKDCKKKKRAFDTIIISSGLVLGRKLYKIRGWINSLLKNNITVYVVDADETNYEFTLAILDATSLAFRKRGK